MANLPPKICWAVFLGLACLALALRLPRLGERPMHTDEAVNAFITGDLLAGKGYQYDPKDRHGPALSALALPVVKLARAHDFAGLNETMLRLVPAIVGAATVLGFALVAGQIGFLAALFAAVLFVIAPLPVYYNRYFIHETLFVAATFGLLIYVGRFMKSCFPVGAATKPFGKPWYLGLMAGLSAGVMLACKETALLHYAAIAIAAVGCFSVNPFTRVTGKGYRRPWKFRWGAFFSATGVAVITFLFVVTAFYSWGGTRWQGLSDLIQSIPRLAERASGEGHEKPAWYYLSLLRDGWAGGLIVLTLAVISGLGLVWKELSRDPIIPSAPGQEPAPSPAPRVLSSLDEENPDEQNVSRQFLLTYAIMICAFYSAIPYKTPWLALNLWLPLSLLAGCGFASLWRRARRDAARKILAAFAAVLVLQLAHDTWLRVFAKPIDERNPYAYAHTGEDLLRLPGRMTELAQHLPAKDFRVAVVAADPWPLPWYLRKFLFVGFWQPGQDPGAADIYLTSPEAAGQLSARLENRRPEYFGVRPEVLIILWPPPEKPTAP